MRRSEEPVSMPNPVAAGAPRSYRRMYGGAPPAYRPSEGHDSRRSHPGNEDEEGVEVMLDGHGQTVTKVVDSPIRGGRRPDQNVFRPPPHPTHRPRPMRPPHTHPSMLKSGGSYGYAGQPPPPPRRGDYPSHGRPPSQVPYSQSGSFEENYPGPPPPQHFSPPVHYPTPGRKYQEGDVNVISPNHRPDPYNRPPVTPRSRQVPSSPYYQYPPASPVSRAAGPPTNSPPRRHPGMRRSEGPYSDAQRSANAYHPDDGTFNAFSGERPPLVAESSFDSENYASSHYTSSHPPTPGGHPDPQTQFYGGGSWGSFEGPPHGPVAQGPPPHFDEYSRGYYGYPGQPESPYSHYSPNQGYYGEPYPSHHPSYERPVYEDGEHGMLRDYRADAGPSQVTPHDKKRDGSEKTANGIVLPKAASEIDFVVTAPPMEPVLPPSDHPICDSPASINSHDVLCGRGGGTNSQIGNRRFRKLVQDFQPTYLLARRKEKPLLARTIVLIIRKRGGRFLKKDEETGELYEVGDSKAEAKTSQALREGLDVRATKSAVTSLGDKKKKKKKEDGNDTENGNDVEDAKEDEAEEGDDEEAKETADIASQSRDKTPPKQTQSEAPKTPPPSPPPSLPRLAQGEIKAGFVHPHSPEALLFRKRRRMRSGGCIPLEDKLFPDFCPPRADLQRSASPFLDSDDMEMATTPPHRNRSERYETDHPEPHQPGCAGIALSFMTGAATGSFCLGPSNWRRK